jgi:hypothetical protein
VEYQEPLNARDVAARRAARVIEAWAEVGAGEGAPVTVSTPAGPVVITRLELAPDGQTVEVWVGDPENGDPHFRVVNPPTLVRGEHGALVESPLAAVAQAIADQGGAQRRTGRKRTR